ncbi:hypothetical protein PtB15_6B431 [Puccinia triticina]|nr:hypothetical protein PtB15_6B431 [Puccinia triticina]
MARGRRNEANSVAHSISTGSSRRTRTRQFQMRNASMERREQSAELRDRSIAEQLGHVSPPRRPPQAVAQEALNTENQYPPFEPHLGGNDDRLATPEEDLPSTAHAAYHRARRYAETRERTSQLWSQLESSVTATFTLRQRITTNFTTQPSGYELPPDTCTCSPSEIHTRKVDLFDMLFPFSNSTDLYSRVLTNQTKITNKGMQLTAIEQWAMKCPRCFGPQENKIKAHQDEPHIIIAMDGNFQQCHYAYASKDNPPESKYPSSFIPPSKIAPDATLFTSTKAAAVGIDLEYAHSVYIDSIAALAKLHQEPNRHTPGSNYTNSFFEQQWRDEQAYHVTTNQSSEQAQVELGRLLCMEEELNDAWSAIAMTPEKALTRARSCDTVARKLEAQRRLAPPNSETSNLTGEATTLGTRGQQKLSEALRKRVAQLRTALNDYNRLARSFIQSNPTHAAPPIIDYSALLALQPDDTFWNDGLFTNANKAWAVDPLTQRGIRALACRNRALEEKQRLAWEVRRTARWAVEHHSCLLSLLTLLVHYQDKYEQQTEPVPIPPPLVPFVNHFLLESNKFDIYNICAVELLIHQAYVEVCTLQLDWNDKLIKVFQRTMSQDGDENLLSTWNKQVLRIKHAITNNLLSGIPGNCADLVPFMNQNNHLDLPLPLDENGPDEDDNEQEYFENMEHILSETMRTNLFHEAAETPVSVDKKTDHQSGTINPYAHAP